MSDNMTNVRLTAGARPNTHKLEIQAPSGEWMDISGCVFGTMVRVEAGDVARMELRIANYHGAHEGAMVLMLPRETVRLLRAFGWAEPEGCLNADGSCNVRLEYGAWATAWGMQ